MLHFYLKPPPYSEFRSVAPDSDRETNRDREINKNRDSVKMSFLESHGHCLRILKTMGPDDLQKETSSS